MSKLVITLLALAIVGPSIVQASPTPPQLCESAIELASAKYAQCRLTAESKFSKSSDAGVRTAALLKCSQRLSDAFSKASLRYGASNCTGSSSTAYDAYLTQCSDDVAAAAVAGGALPSCGDGAIDVVGEQCDGVDLGGETCASLGFPGGGSLACTAGCLLDTSACSPSLCGNGKIDGVEQCDGMDLGGVTCGSLGYTNGGALGCMAGCGYDVSACGCDASSAAYVIQADPSPPLDYHLVGEKAQWDLVDEKPNLPVPRQLVYLDNRLYFIGGSLANQPVGTVTSYDLTTKVWSNLAPLPVARSGAAVAAVAGKVYAFGGHDGVGYVDAVSVYDVATNTWASGAPMPTARYGAAAAYLDGKIYVVDGHGVVDLFTPVVEAYDPLTDSWEVRAPTNTLHGGTHGLAVLGGRLFVVGGNQSNAFLNQVEAYDPVLNVWVNRASLPRGRRNPGTAVLAGLLYAVGGYSDWVEIQSTYSYDANGNIWREELSPVPVATGSVQAVAADGKIYALTGGALWSYEPRRTYIFEHD